MKRTWFASILVASIIGFALVGCKSGSDASSKPSAALTNPTLASAQAPQQFKTRVRTTKGEFVIEVERSWAPLGADRFYNLVKAGFFQDAAFFRVVDGFVAQFGIHYILTAEVF